MALKPYHHGDLREKLLIAGEEVLAELPLAEVALREIARRAGVSHAAPKHHFATLGDLLGEIAARGFLKFVVALATAADNAHEQTPTARLMAMGWAYFRFAEANPAVYGLMFGQLENTVMTPALTNAAYEAWSQLEAAVAAITGPNRAAVGAVHVWSSVHGLAMLKAAHRLPPHISLHAVEDDKLRMMMAGLKDI